MLEFLNKLIEVVKDLPPVSEPTYVGVGLAITAVAIAGWFLIKTEDGSEKSDKNDGSSNDR